MFGSPPLRHQIVLLVLIAVGFALPPFVPEYYLFLLNSLMVWAALALGLDLLMGWSGQFAFAHMAFFGVGCYATVILTKQLDLPFLLAMPGGALIAAVVGVLVASPSTRLRSIYLALATFAFAEGARFVFNSWTGLTGGPDGLRIPTMTIAGWKMTSDRQVFPVLAIILAMLLFATQQIVRSRFGREMSAVRDSEHVAMASGIDVRRVKVLAFTVSALYSGIAGGMYALINSFINAQQFGMDGAVLALSMVVVGGMGSIPGVLIGVVLIGLLPVVLQTTLRSMQLWQELIYGVVLTLSVTFMPRGIWGAARSALLGRR